MAAHEGLADADELEETKGLDDDDGGGDGVHVALLKLVSKDGQQFMIERQSAMISYLVKTALESDPSAAEVHIPGVEGPILAKIVEYMQQHKGVEPPIIPSPLRSKFMKEVVTDPWDAAFVDQICEHRQHIYDLILAANYMSITPLVHLSCAKVASLIKGQAVENVIPLLSTGPRGSVNEEKQ